MLKLLRAMKTHRSVSALNLALLPVAFLIATGFREQVVIILSRDLQWELKMQIVRGVLYGSAGIALAMWYVFSCKRVIRSRAALLMFFLLFIGLYLFAEYVIQTGMISKKKAHFRYMGDGVYTFLPGDVIVNNITIPGSEGRIVYRIDQDGHRACPYTIKQAKTRILLVGDSFMFGVLLDTPDTLCGTLGAALEKRGMRDFSITNAGIPNLEMAAYLKIISLNMKFDPPPDWIVVGYLAHNDFTPYDVFYEMDHLEHDPAFRLAAVLLGVVNMSRYLSWRELSIMQQPLDADKIQPAVKTLCSLAKTRHVAVISYEAPDLFTSALQKCASKIHVIDFEITRKPEYMIPNDGHPKAVANRDLGARLAEIIFAGTTLPAKSN